MWIYNLNNLNGLEGIYKKILIKFGVNINLIYWGIFFVGFGVKLNW